MKSLLFKLALFLISWGICTHLLAKPILKIAFSDNKTPYSNSTCQCGVEFEIVQTIVKNMGYELEPHFAPNKRMLLMLKSGEVDGIIGVIENKPRNNGFTTKPYIRFQNVALTLQDRHLPIESLKDLKGLKVAAFQNASLNLGYEYAYAISTASEYEEVSPQLLQNKLLYGGRTDAVIADLYIFLASNQLVKEQVNTMQKLDLHYVFPATEYVLEFHNKQFRDAFNQQLQPKNLKKIYQQLADKYFQPLMSGAVFLPMPSWMN